MSNDFSFSIQPKRLGVILQEANLISLPQIELALRDQTYYPDLRLGEIIAMRGWIKQETADFFAQNWWSLLKQKERKSLGYYLQKSGLLEEEQVEAILQEQRATGIRFGSIAVLQGLLKSQTLDFFLMNLFPKEFSKSSLVSKRQANNQKSQPSFETPTLIQDLEPSKPEVEDTEDFEITWIG